MIFMKRLFLLLVFVFIGFISNAQIVNIPDANFKAKLVASSTSNGTAQNVFGVNIKIDTNNNGEIEVSETIPVSYLFIVGNPNVVNSFEGIQSFTNLKTFTSMYNVTPVLNLSGLTHLEYVDCKSTQVQTLNLTGCTALTYLDCSLNSTLTSFDLSSATNLQTLIAEFSGMPSIDVSNHASLTSLKAKQSSLVSLNVSGCSLLNNIDVTMCPMTTIDVSGLTNLVTLQCNGDYVTVLNSINLTGCTSLHDLSCNSRFLAAIDLSGLTGLSTLSLEDNALTTLDLTGAPNLTTANCGMNNLTAMDLTGMTQLTNFNCYSNQIANLNLGALPNFTTLDCNTNLLTNLDVTGMTGLTSIAAYGNLFTTVDVNSCPNLYAISCGMNPNLIQVFAKTGRPTNVNVYNAPNLEYVCVESPSQITSTGFTGHTNSYCTFTPGGTFYTIQGAAKFDYNTNGCDALDTDFLGLKITYNNGSAVATNIADFSGNYHYDVQAGTYTISPVLENPTYFNVSPTTQTVTFPAQTSPFVQNFCITSNGSHPDVEITIIPLSDARPGFDAEYKIIYKNKGNQMQSGSIDLTFNDAVMDLVSAQPLFATQSPNHLVWNFTNLNIFTTREITVKMHLNAPTDTPPLNGNDILNFTATASVTSDETPANNVSTLHQILVNSFDPNDKTCVEGKTITPSMLGDYVHYVIRFENTGTANAQNIVVKDMIDTAKFDINTLVPLSGSHPFVTRITATNKVEFIFESINLPFDNANNDGYVAFKIKTKSTLVVGNTFSNTASIYFDYNFPIITNTETTTIQTLGTQDFDFGKYFTISPNPVHQTLNFDTKATISIKSMNIYNILGQMVMAIPNAQSISGIDVSDLKTGTYFIKVNTDRGSSNAKFIKN
jgi:hypothetical protein